MNKKTFAGLIIAAALFFASLKTFAQQAWEPPLEKADLLLFSTHADDEHLFFAGILPYCAANGINAQVVYINDHHDQPARRRERTDGLWAVGITNEPVVGDFPDLFSESLEEGYQVYARRGFSEDDFTAFCVENIRRFKPLVAVGHDINGEYGHGGHSIAARALMQAAVLAADENYHPESAALYGTWDTPKTYLHLWQERQIKINIDEPLNYFDGKTAFQVSQYGFSYHKSQHWTWFYKWLYGAEDAPVTKASQITTYSPVEFGLYRTTVGSDPKNADHFFYNVILQKDFSSAPQELPEENAFDGSGADGGETLKSTLNKKVIFGIILTGLCFLLTAAIMLYRKKRKK